MVEAYYLNNMQKHSARARSYKHS